MSIRKLRYRQTLLAAADLIETKGWCKGTYSKGGRHCVYGAILDAGNLTVPPALERLVIKAIGEPGLTIGDLAEWNDSQKTRRPVVTALRRAADLAIS